VLLGRLQVEIRRDHGRQVRRAQTGAHAAANLRPFSERGRLTRAAFALVSGAMGFLWLVFGLTALAMFVVAFNHILKGRIGMAVVFGVMAVLMSGVAGAVAVYVD